MAAPGVDRAAVPADIDEICSALPETWLGTSWGDVPTWLVPHRDRGRGFVLYRKPHRSAVDPESGLPHDDVVVIRTADAADKAVLVDGPGPFFTIDHFNGHNAVLIRLSRVGEISRAELAEVITDAWLACASKTLAARFRAQD